MSSGGSGTEWRLVIQLEVLLNEALECSVKMFAR